MGTKISRPVGGLIYMYTAPEVEAPTAEFFVKREGGTNRLLKRTTYPSRGAMRREVGPVQRLEDK